MVDSISRIQFLFLHSLGAVPSPFSVENGEENSTTENDKVGAEGEDEAQSISSSSSSGSGSSPCIHHLRGSSSLIDEDKSGESFLSMFLFFSSPLQFLAESSFTTRKSDPDDDYWRSIDGTYFYSETEEGD
jgi:hypothetical protein